MVLFVYFETILCPFHILDFEFFAERPSSTSRMVPICTMLKNLQDTWKEFFKKSSRRKATLTHSIGDLDEIISLMKCPPFISMNLPFLRFLFVNFKTESLKRKHKLCVTSPNAENGKRRVLHFEWRLVCIKKRFQWKSSTGKAQTFEWPDTGALGNRVKCLQIGWLLTSGTPELNR